MKIYDTFNELAGLSPHVSNAEYFGLPSSWDEDKAEPLKEAVEILEKQVLEHQQNLNKQPVQTLTPEERQLCKKKIERIVLKIIDKNKGDYALIKKHLSDLNIEALSDIYFFDDHFDENYGSK